MRDGEIVEQGRHDELVDLNGLYAKMWLAQQAEELSEIRKRSRTRRCIESVLYYYDDDQGIFLNMLSGSNPLPSLSNKSAALLNSFECSSYFYSYTSLSIRPIFALFPCPS